MHTSQQKKKFREVILHVRVTMTSALCSHAIPNKGKCLQKNGITYRLFWGWKEVTKAWELVLTKPATHKNDKYQITCGVESTML
jgi:hypothetical protein